MLVKSIISPVVLLITSQFSLASDAVCVASAVPTNVISPVRENVACPEPKVTERDIFQELYVASLKL